MDFTEDYTLDWFQKQIPLVDSITYSEMTKSAVQQQDDRPQKTISKSHTYESFLKAMEKLDVQDNFQNDADQENLDFYSFLHIGEVLQNRYIVMQNIGTSKFSTVWLCRDALKDKYVAIKVAKAERKYPGIYVNQVILLKALRGSKNIIQIQDNFIYKNVYGSRYCIVLEHMKCSLAQFIKSQKINKEQCLNIISQVVNGVAEIHSKNIIHTDLKPQNIMLGFLQQYQYNQNLLKSSKRLDRFRQLLNLQKQPFSSISTIQLQQQSSEIQYIQLSDQVIDMLRINSAISTKQKLNTLNIKIIDFGNALLMTPQANFRHKIQTRQYRCPQVILGDNFSYSADIWSLGCIAFEILTTKKLFSPFKRADYSKDIVHLYQMLTIQQAKAFQIFAGAPKYSEYFDEEHSLKYDKQLVFKSLGDILALDQQGAQFVSNLIVDFLKINPFRRITAGDALNIFNERAGKLENLQSTAQLQVQNLSTSIEYELNT